MANTLWPLEEATTGPALAGANSIQLKGAGTFLHAPFDAAWSPRMTHSTMEFWMSPDPVCEIFDYANTQTLFCPIVYVTDPGASKLVWAIGLLSTPVGLYMPHGNVRMVVVSDTAHEALPYGPDIALVADHWRHIAAVWANGKVTQWGERKIGPTVAFDTGGYEVPEGARMIVGGTRMPIPGSIAGAKLVPFVGRLDEIRFTLAARYAAVPPTNLPESQLKLPWPSKGP